MWGPKRAADKVAGSMAAMSGALAAAAAEFEVAAAAGASQVVSAVRRPSLQAAVASLVVAAPRAWTMMTLAGAVGIGTGLEAEMGKRCLCSRHCHQCRSASSTHAPRFCQPPGRSRRRHSLAASTTPPPRLRLSHQLRRDRSSCPGSGTGTQRVSPAPPRTPRLLPPLHLALSPATSHRPIHRQTGPRARP